MLLPGSSSSSSSKEQNSDRERDSSSCTGSDLESDSSSSVVSSAQLSSLIADGNGSTLMHLLQLKNGLTSFEVTLRETGGAMRDLLETDEDMAEMYLSLKKTGRLPHSSEHGEVEVILETYLRKVDELLNEVEQMVRSITLTEEHIQIRLDSTRNSMMKLELLCSICTFGVTSAALGAALFGMNLPNGFEKSPLAFVGATAIFMILGVLIVRKGITIAKKRSIHLFQIDPSEPMLRLPYVPGGAGGSSGGSGSSGAEGGGIPLGGHHGKSGGGGGDTRLAIMAKNKRARQIAKMQAYERRDKN